MQVNRERIERVRLMEQVVQGERTLKEVAVDLNLSRVGWNESSSSTVPDVFNGRTVSTNDPG